MSALQVGDRVQVNKDDQAMNLILNAEIIHTPRGEGDVWGFRCLDTGVEIFTNERITMRRKPTND